MNTLYGKRLVSSQRPTILAYHAITHLSNDPNGSATSPRRFKSQMLSLKLQNLRGVCVRELRRATNAGDDGRKLVGITFDDGYADFLHTALPVLEELGFSATVFAVAGMLGGSNDWEHVYEPRPQLRLLTAEELREVSKLGMEVGSHGMTHRRLPDLDSAALEQEVKHSRLVLEEIVGEAVEGFCYPYGSSSGAVLEAVRRAGYNYACGWREQDEYHDYELPRVPVLGRDGLLRFEAKLKVYRQYS